MTALEGLSLVDSDAYTALTLLGDVPEQAIGSEALRGVARHLYEALRKRRYPYDQPAFYLGTSQRIRDPRAIHQGTATCLDISLLFAGMCKAAGLKPHLVVLEDYRLGEQPDHALVLVDLRDWTSEPPAEPVEEVDWGVVWLLTRRGERTALQAGVVAVDVMQACRNMEMTFDGACERGSAIITDAGYAQVHLVNVLAVQQARAIDARNDQGELDDEGEAHPPAGADRPAIYPNLPAMPSYTSYPSRARQMSELRGASGVVVILGQSGTGKSMLAHHVAATVDHGCGWFLDASSKLILTKALASGEARETGQHLSSVDGPEAVVLRTKALQRLHAATGPWAVVLDNANRGPDEYRGVLPRPDPRLGQLLIITTTEESWRGYNARFVDLRPLEDQEVITDLDESAPLEAVAGRPLLVSASRRFRASAGRWWWATHPVTGARQPDQAPARFWAAVEAELAQDELARRLARGISWLPPVRLPISVLGALADEGSVFRAAISRLSDAGLIDVVGETVTMHRLFRAAVRADGLSTDQPGQVQLVHQILGNDRSSAVLEAAADLETASEMGRLLSGWLDDDVAVSGLHRLGRVFERQESAQASAEWYEQALARTPDPIPERHMLRAVDAMRGKARARMRGTGNPSPTERRQELEEAIGWTITAAGLCEGRKEREFLIAASQVEAMHGLLRRATVDSETERSARLALLREAEVLLRSSAASRAQLVDDPQNSPEVDRSRYNLAGLEVRLAQEDEPQNAADHLNEALKHYTEILAIRRERYRTDELEEVVCCINGQAIVAYYRAALLRDPWPFRSAQLRVATELSDDAKAIRQRLAGEFDDDNSTKSVGLTAKIALARLGLAEAMNIKGERDARVIGDYSSEREGLVAVPAEAF